MTPDIRATFEPAEGLAYLDAATYGLPPRPTVEAMHRALEMWQSGTADWVRDWDVHGEDARSGFADLLGTESTSIALVPSVSTAVGVIAAWLRAGDEVVVPADEFTSVLFPLLAAQQWHGTRIRQVPFEQVAEAISPATRLVAFSLVQSQSGRRANLEGICSAAAAAGAQVLVDATHAIPFVPVRQHLAAIDFLVCAGYKHLLCPRGTTFFYIAPRRQEELPPIAANWRSARDPYGQYYGGPLSLAESAARFDVSLAWFSWVGAAQSLRLLGEWQRAGILDEVRRLTARLAESLRLSAPESSVLSVPVQDAEGVRQTLQRAGIRASVRAGAVRLSPHVYNTAADVDRAAEAISPFVRVDGYTPAPAVPGQVR